MGWATCEEVQGLNVLGMFNRGRDRHIGFIYGKSAWLCVGKSCTALSPSIVPRAESAGLFAIWRLISNYLGFEGTRVGLGWVGCQV